MKIVLRKLVSAPAMIAIIASLGLPYSHPAIAENSAYAGTHERVGVTDTEIMLASCIRMTGVAGDRGRVAAQGAGTYFSYINDQGGVNGRKIKYQACDDHYDPEKAVECFNTCLKDKVFAGTMFAGSAVISRYVRMADQTKMPLVGFLTGATALYEGHTSSFVLQPSYKQEVEHQVESLWKHNLRRIGVVYQNDSFGASFREGTIQQLKKHNALPVVEYSYNRNQMDPEDAFKKVLAANPQAVIMGANSVSLKPIVKLRNDLGVKAVIMCFSACDDMLHEIGKPSDGFVVSQVLPPLDNSLPTVALFRKQFAKYHPGMEPHMFHFIAFLNAKILVDGIKQAGRDLTRSKLVRALESMQDYDLGIGPKYRLHFGPNQHVGWTPKAIYLSVMRDGKLIPMGEAAWAPITKAAN